MAQNKTDKEKKTRKLKPKEFLYVASGGTTLQWGVHPNPFGEKLYDLYMVKMTF